MFPVADALPVDASGRVVPPAIPTEPRLQIPLDELLAKKLARGLVPVRLVGSRGSGKNDFVKYLFHRTNLGYLSVDCDEATYTEDLFWPLTPTEDGLVAPRNGPAKQALLNRSVLVLNEFPVMRAGAAMSLHRLLNEGKPLVKAHGELVELHTSTRIAITVNPQTRKYRDPELVNSATRGRFRAPFTETKGATAIRWPSNPGRNVETFPSPSLPLSLEAGRYHGFRPGHR